MGTGAAAPAVRQSVCKLACRHTCGRTRKLLRHAAERVDELVHQRQQLLVARLAQHQRVAEVVDVLAGARKMRELEHLRQLRVLAQPRFEHILYRLDVMIRGALDVLHLLRDLGREVVAQVVQECVCFCSELGHFRHVWQRREHLQPAALHQHAELDQPVL